MITECLRCVGRLPDVASFLQRVPLIVLQALPV